MHRYLEFLFGAAIATLLLVAAINWVVDPFGIYGSPRVDGFNSLKPGIASRARLFKTVVTARGDWEALIVGTSRADVGLDPWHPIFHGRRCFNAGIGGQPIEEGLKLVQAAAERGSLKQVVAALDFPVSNAYYTYPKDFVSANYLPWRGLALALVAESLAQSLATPFRQAVPQKYGIWRQDGRYEIPESKGHRIAALVSERDYLRSNYFPPPEFAYSLSAQGREPLRHFRQLVAFAHSRGIELSVMIAPAHARQWETVAAAGLWATWEEWKRRLVTINEDEARAAGHPPFPLWDFSGYSTITTEPFPALSDRKTRMVWYSESSHFTKAAGDLALDRMRGIASQGRSVPGDFGVLLTSESLESHLADIRAARYVWRARNPLDVAEIESLGREAAQWRAMSMKRDNWRRER